MRDGYRYKKAIGIKRELVLNQKVIVWLFFWLAL